MARPARWFRRRAVGLAAAVLLTAGGVAGIAVSVYRSALRSNVDELSFRTPLRIPALLEPDLTPDGRRVFHLTVAPGRSRLRPGAPTATWGVNQAYLGPTLRAGRGDRIVARVTNGLPETTTSHWHGMHLPAVADGGPHSPVPPGRTWTAAWTVDQPAATLWYHAHPEGRTGPQVYRGVAGLFIVDDPAAGDAGLPHRYGVDDIPLVLQDKRFTAANALDEDHPRFSPVGILGGDILVNGTYDPYLRVTARRVRLRVLNASNARTFDLGFGDGRRFLVVAGDAGYLPAPVAVRRVRVAPSERVEVVVEVEPAERVVLRSHATGLGGGRLPPRFAGGDDVFDLVRLVAARRLEPAPAVPARLPAPAAVEPGPGARARAFTFNHASRINGRVYDHDRTDFTMRAGEVEVWTLRNGSDNQHVFHPHGVSFTVMEYGGHRPPPTMRGPKDSLLLPPGTAATIAVRAPTAVDPAHPYMFHCHVLAHEDHGMMGQFAVVA